MQQVDNVRQLVLDHSASDFSGAAGYGAAVVDATAQTALIDCQVADEVDVIVSLSALGAGPVTKVTIVGRCSSSASPDVTVPVDWATLNTEALDTATGIASIVMYQAEVAVSAVGQIVVTFPARERYFSAVVWVDSAVGSRGEVYLYRRED